MPPREAEILPRTMVNLPKLTDEEWKKIGWKRKKPNITNVTYRLPSIVIVSPVEK